MTIDEKITKNLKSYTERVEGIRADWTMSDAAKAHQITKEYEKARSHYSELREEKIAGIKANLKDRRKSVFSAPTMFGSDKALQIMAYRDALDRVSRVTDRHQLSDLLARAEVTGDHPLARAVLWRGYELQDEAIVGSYLEKYPDERQGWDSFMGAAEEFNEVEALGVPGEPERPQETSRGYVAERA